MQNLEHHFAICCPFAFGTNVGPFSLSVSESWRAQLANAGTRCAPRDPVLNPRVLKTVLIMSSSHDYPEIYVWDRGTVRTDGDEVLMKQEAQGSESFIGNIQQINIRPYRTSYTHGVDYGVFKANRPWKIFPECRQPGVSNLWPMGHKQIAMKGPMVLRPLELN